MTTQLSFENWIAIENKAWATKKKQIPLHFVRFFDDAFTVGVEEHLIEGLLVKMCDAAKTVADCFKHRHKIGLDVALEAWCDGLLQLD